MVLQKSKLQVGLKNYPYSLDESVICSRCQKRYSDDDNVLMIAKTGLCTKCDHVEAEESEDRLKEHYENQEDNDD
jgi:hypothetical protein